MKPGDIILTLLVITLWGGNFIAMRFGAQEPPPYLLLGLRLAVASVALVWFAKSPRGMVLPLMLISTTLCTFHFGLALVGVQYIEAGTGALAMQASVPFAALIAWILFRETFGWRRWVGLWYRLVQRYQTNLIKPFTILVPVIAVLFGILLPGEAPTWQLALGGMITISGVAIVVIRGPDTVAGGIVGDRAPVKNP